MAQSKDGILRVNTNVRLDNVPTAKRLLRKRGAWSEFVNSRLAEQAQKERRRQQRASQPTEKTNNG